MRRTRLAAALAAVLAVGVVATSVATAAKHSAAVKPTCFMALSAQIQPGETAINPADTSGANTGSIKCGKLLGAGLAQLSFTMPASGNLVGAAQEYFALGSMHGKYVLVPDDPTSDSFSAASYTGTMTIKGGTGAFQMAKGTGKLKCTTTDSIHLSCVEHLKLTSL